MSADAIINFAYEGPVEDAIVRAKRPGGEWGIEESIELPTSVFDCYSREVLVPVGRELPPGSQCGVMVLTSGRLSEWSADTDCEAVPEPGLVIGLIAGAILLRVLKGRRS